MPAGGDSGEPGPGRAGGVTLQAPCSGQRRAATEVDVPPAAERAGPRAPPITRPARTAPRREGACGRSRMVTFLPPTRSTRATVNTSLSLLKGRVGEMV